MFENLQLLLRAFEQRQDIDEDAPQHVKKLQMCFLELLNRRAVRYEERMLRLRRESNPKTARVKQLQK